MKFKILKNFTVIIQKNKTIDWIKEDTKIDYNSGDVIKDVNGVKYLTLKNLFEGNLIIGTEFQIFTGGTQKVKDSKDKINMIVELEDDEILWDDKYIQVIE